MFRLGLASCAASLAALICTVSSPARAEIVDQVWIGGYAHDITDWGLRKEGNTADVQLEVDTAQPDILRFLGAPHLNATLALNTAGKTDFGSVGLAWDRRLWGSLYGSLQFGIGDSDGVTGPSSDPKDRNRLLLGSKLLFREAGGLNWRMKNHWLIGVQYVHASNGLILGHRYNEGINDLGIRIGYRFK
jgi:Lipid A 3-O-deacylase (PagL)